MKIIRTFLFVAFGLGGSVDAVPGADETFTVKLEYTEELNRWSVNYYRPSHVDLSPDVPNDMWTVPLPRGKQRLYGSFALGKESRVNALVDVLDEKQTAIRVTADDNFNFGDTPDYVARKKWMTSVKYADGTTQPYALEFYFPVPFALRIGKNRLHYYRACLREGTLQLGEQTWSVAIVDDNNNGLYSDLKETSILWKLTDIKRFVAAKSSMATSACEFDGRYYSVASISDSGDTMTVRPSRMGDVRGLVTDADTGQPLAGTQVSLPFRKQVTTTGIDGRYLLSIPEGQHYELQLSYEGYVPEFVRFRQQVAPDQPVIMDVALHRPTDQLSGTRQLKKEESYHFLGGTSGFLSGGDFYVSLTGPAQFFCNNAHQRGVRQVDARLNQPLDEIAIPKDGFTRMGVPAVEGQVYVALARQGEEGHHVVLRVLKIVPDESVEVEYLYR